MFAAAESANKVKKEFEGIEEEYDRLWKQVNNNPLAAKMTLDTSAFEENYKKSNRQSNRISQRRKFNEQICNNEFFL